MKYKYHILSLFTMGIYFAFFFSVHAQVVGSDKDNLFKLYSEGRFEDCLYKAENYMYKEKTKKDADVYLYMSMCFYQLARIEKHQEYYKNAFRYCMKQGAKARKYDKENVFYEQNVDYYIKIKEWALEKAKEAYTAEKYSKTSSIYGMILKIDPDDENIRFTRGVCDILARNTGVGLLRIKTALGELEPGYKSDKITEPLIRVAFVVYSDYLYNKSAVDTLHREAWIDSSRSTIKIGKGLFPSDNEIDTQHNKVNK